MPGAVDISDADANTTNNCKRRDGNKRGDSSDALQQRSKRRNSGGNPRQDGKRRIGGGNPRQSGKRSGNPRLGGRSAAATTTPGSGAGRAAAAEWVIPNSAPACILESDRAMRWQ